MTNNMSERHEYTSHGEPGLGSNIGIERVFHIVVSRIPDKSEYNDKWLKKYIQERIGPTGASVQHVEKLRSNNPQRRSSTQAFKISISFAGCSTVLYNAANFPLNAKVGRFRFPKQYPYNRYKPPRYKR